MGLSTLINCFFFMGKKLLSFVVRFRTKILILLMIALFGVCERWLAGGMLLTDMMKLNYG